MGFEKKIYIDNSYLSELDAEVIDCTKNEKGLFEVKLNKTIFYPNMLGGQLEDRGKINDFEVIHIFENEATEEIIHILKEPVHGTVHMTIDMDRRIDLMQQHTGQHILSAAFWKLYKGKTVGFHMAETYTTIDIALKDVSKKMIKNVEILANENIYKNIPVDCKIYNRKDAMATGLRKAPVDSDCIRTVKIDGVDNIACCGTHTKTTGEIGLIKIVKFENYKGGIRVEFLCGKRAFKHYQSVNTIVYTLSNDFSCKITEITEAVKKRENTVNNLLKTISEQNDKLIEYEYKELLEEAKSSNDKLVKVFRGENTKRLRNLMTKLIENDNFEISFINCDLDERGADSKLLVMMGKSKNRDFDLKTRYSQVMKFADGKGGGNDYICQGSTKKIDLLKNIEKLLKSY